MRIAIDGVSDTLRTLRDVQGRLRNVAPAMQVAAADVVTFTTDRFATSTDPRGRAWQPLAESTVRARRRGSSVPLVDTGRLRSSISATGQARGLRFGTNVVYAGTHQFGRGRIPQRQFLPVDRAGDTYTLVMDGQAGIFWRRLISDIEHYIATGELR